VAVVDFDVHHGNGTEEIARAWHARHRKAGARAASVGLYKLNPVVTDSA
jgi:acetoin utilization deacetylase AcuC-like enzyme